MSATRPATGRPVMPTLFLPCPGGVGAPAYEAQLAEIDRRLAALPLLR